MLISPKKVAVLEAKEIIVPTYKVLTSYNYFDQSDLLSANRYMYYSLSYEHHLYFLVKRILQQIDSKYDIDISNSRDKHFFAKLCEVINYLECDTHSEPFDVYGREFLYDTFLKKLMMDNAYNNSTSNRGDVIKLSDTKRLGGGMGLKGLWLALFDILTFCEREYIISKRDVINYLTELKDCVSQYGIKTYSYFQINKAQDLCKDGLPFTVRDSLLVDQSDTIRGYLEQIVDQKLAHSKSNLKACHKEVTEQFIANYQADRALFLKRLGKKPKTNSGRIY